MQIGLRDMRAKLSEVVEKVKGGEDVSVTDRGVVVAVLVAPQKLQGDDGLRGALEAERVARERAETALREMKVSNNGGAATKGELAKLRQEVADLRAENATLKSRPVAPPKAQVSTGEDILTTKLTPELLAKLKSQEDWEPRSGHNVHYCTCGWCRRGRSLIREYTKVTE